ASATAAMYTHWRHDAGNGLHAYAELRASHARQRYELGPTAAALRLAGGDLINHVFQEGGIVRPTVRSLELDLAAGLSRDGGWDAGLSRQRSETTLSTEGAVRTSRLLDAVADGYFPGFTPLDPALRAQLFPRTRNRGRTDQWLAWWGLRRDLGQLPGGAAQLAGGIDLRHETWTSRPDRLLEDGELALGLPTGRRRLSRQSSAAYAELGLPLAAPLRLDLAGRLDHDAGELSFSPRAGLRWNPSPAWSLLLSSGRVRAGVTQLSVEHDSSARMWLEKNFDAVVLTLYRFPGWLAEAQRTVTQLVKPSIRSVELAGMLRDLAVMTSSGIPIMESLRAVANEVGGGRTSNAARLARRLLDELDAGASLSDAVSRYPDAFPETVRNLLMIGDETGTMDKMLMESADHIERISKMTADTRQALIYPAFVFSAIFAAGGFWIYYVIPNLADLFKQMNAKLPPLTIAVMKGSEWLIGHIGFIAVAMVVAAFVLWVAWRYSRGFRRAAHYTLHKLPIARTIMYSSGLAFFTEYMALLIRAGVDMVSSLQVMERAMRDEYYRDRIIAIRQVLERGDRVSAAMRQVGGFPSMMVRMIGVGEET
ncbi:MAG: TonB-dependent receptor, partial [Stenotrophomonas nitritireducens]|nr:TonB-dependent receptor [Stenotrophomonas nitritireducens]